jgi:hypothetical protein
MAGAAISDVSIEDAEEMLKDAINNYYNNLEAEKSSEENE